MVEERKVAAISVADPDDDSGDDSSPSAVSASHVSRSKTPNTVIRHLNPSLHHQQSLMYTPTTDGNDIDSPLAIDDVHPALMHAVTLPPASDNAGSRRNSIRATTWTAAHLGSPSTGASNPPSEATESNDTGSLTSQATPSLIPIAAITMLNLAIAAPGSKERTWEQTADLTVCQTIADLKRHAFQTAQAAGRSWPAEAYLKSSIFLPGSSVVLRDDHRVHMLLYHAHSIKRAADSATTRLIEVFIDLFPQANIWPIKTGWLLKPCTFHTPNPFFVCDSDAECIHVSDLYAPLNGLPVFCSRCIQASLEEEVLRYA